MKLKQVRLGIHTIELYARKLKYHQIQKTIDHLVDQGSIQQIYSDSYSIDRYLNSTYLVARGIRMRLHQSHNKSNGISFAVNPSTLLTGAYQPLALYQPTKENVVEMQSHLADMFEEIHLSDHEMPILAPDELSLSRMDLTVDLWFSKDTDLSSLIRIFRKSMLPRHYKHRELEGKQDYFFELATKEISFKVYDKIYELEQNDRCPKKYRKERILRLEVSMRREAFLEKLGLKRKDDLFAMLKMGYDNVCAAIGEFLDKLFPAGGMHLPYPEAERKIQQSKLDSAIKEQMLFLLKKTSRGAGLDTAAQKWKETYSVVDIRKFHALMKQFDKLQVNPVTLTSREQQGIPCLRAVIEQELAHDRFRKKVCQGSTALTGTERVIRTVMQLRI